VKTYIRVSGTSSFYLEKVEHGKDVAEHRCSLYSPITLHCSISYHSDQQV